MLWLEARCGRCARWLWPSCRHSCGASCGYAPPRSTSWARGPPARPCGAPGRRCRAARSRTPDEGENASFTPEVIISRVEALTEELYEKHGVQLFIVAGLPVTGCLPLVQLLMQSFRKFCLKHVALSLIWLWGRCGADQWQAMCLDLERSLPGCKAIFFDQAAALERVAGKNRGDALGETGGFWMDVLHPTAFGHSLIEADFKLLWQAIEAQHEMPGPSRPTGMGRGAQAAPSSHGERVAATRGSSQTSSEAGEPQLHFRICGDHGRTPVGYARIVRDAMEFKVLRFIAGRAAAGAASANGASEDVVIRPFWDAGVETETVECNLDLTIAQITGHDIGSIRSLF
ncbi:unnamed protein product [Prorocentrum cordatum]|uniref:Uncharacterized protein n=1 Tax=Prorocentrum cordatum TaxID=2364126 RepID=A0ABN9Y913_9DINO|nr:unnamed protein product [Polarella glacialis]